VRKNVRYNEKQDNDFFSLIINLSRNIDELIIQGEQLEYGRVSQGVFDTSLENEYTLLASCLERQVNEDGTSKYSSSMIRHYLDELRVMGNMQVFPKAFQSEEESWRK
jgi:hypothetical protein